MSVAETPRIMTLRQWALLHGIEPVTAGRRLRAGRLLDPDGQPVYTQRLTATGTILVFPNGKPDSLHDVDPHALVAKLEEAGFVVLTRDQARRLGIDQPPSLAATG